MDPNRGERKVLPSILINSLVQPKSFLIQVLEELSSIPIPPNLLIFRDIRMKILWPCRTFYRKTHYIFDNRWPLLFSMVFNYLRDETYE